ncbi:alpha/beta hydrolase family protein [Shewanella olleyana]|uniref:DUF3530 family protein n=1 Tax=Shewanella olleyana TaxID=135626 RepID=UPI0020102EC4|nr:DUF3530 family protein [Shewanella olleyana]MCL1067401.1 alpha/beta hydrolase family protein [Shewanella olleyana]
MSLVFSLSLFSFNAYSANYLYANLFSASLLSESVFTPVSDNEKQQIIVQDKPVEVLVKPWEGKKQRGAVVLIGPTDTHASGRGFIRYLRQEVPSKGWATISLKPTEGLYRPNFSTSADQVAKAGEKQIELDPHQVTPKYSSSQLLELRNFQQNVMNECLAQLDGIGAQYPGKRIIIAADDSVGMVVNLLHQDKLAKPDLLVVINPYREFEQLVDEQNRDLSIAMQLKELDIPILDLQSANANRVSVSEAEMRKQQNRIKSSHHYRQYVLQLDLNHQGGWEEALKHIEGFARKIVGR